MGWGGKEREQGNIGGVDGGGEGYANELQSHNPSAIALQYHLIRKRVSCSTLSLSLSLVGFVEWQWLQCRALSHSPQSAAYR